MLLSREDAELFFRLHRSLMCFVNERLRIVPDIRSPEQFSALSLEIRVQVRDAFMGEPDILDSFLDANPDHMTQEELDIVSSWRHYVFGKFFVFRYLKRHTVFLATDPHPTAYGVLALSEPLEDLIGPYLPAWIETMLLPFRGRIVYDGLLKGHNISFGGGVRRMLNDSYKEAKEGLGVISSLPNDTDPARTPKRAKQAAKSKAKAKSRAVRADEAKEVLQVVVGMTDEFCREHLNEEYAVLCRKLAEKLARKRPSPLVGGRPTTWACAIVRTIGWANFLDDRAQRPHMKLTAIDKAFGVGASTGQGKSMQIRKMLKIRTFDHEWMLPSRMDDSLAIWMLEVNGFMMDIRNCPREAQQIAFEKGLIPYIPADRD